MQHSNSLLFYDYFQAAASCSTSTEAWGTSYKKLPYYFCQKNSYKCKIIATFLTKTILC